MFESKNVFGLMYGKKSYFFPPFLRRAPKRFRCFWDARPQWYMLFIKHMVKVLANVLYFVRIDHFHVRDS